MPLLKRSCSVIDAGSIHRAGGGGLGSVQKQSELRSKEKEKESRKERARIAGWLARAWAAA